MCSKAVKETQAWVSQCGACVLSVVALWMHFRAPVTALPPFPAHPHPMLPGGTGQEVQAPCAASCP